MIPAFAKVSVLAGFSAAFQKRPQQRLAPSADCFHLLLKAIIGRAIFVSQPFPLGRAKIPGADPGAIQPAQAASAGAEVAAPVGHGRDGLSGRQGTVRKMQKQKVLCIEPDSGRQAAGRRAADAGGCGEVFHDGSQGGDPLRKGLSQAVKIFGPDFAAFQCRCHSFVYFGPLVRCAPGGRRGGKDALPQGPGRRMNVERRTPNVQRRTKPLNPGC